MIKLLALLKLAFSTYSLVTITGTINYPNGVGVNGKVVITMPQSGVTNTCTTPVSIVPLTPITAKITNGTLTSFNLYSTACLSPQIQYVSRMYNQFNQLIYVGHLTVSNCCSVQDFSQLDLDGK